MALQAQSLEVTGLAGYQFTSNVNWIDFKAKFGDDPTYAGILDINISPDAFVEVMYHNSVSNVRIEPYYGYGQPISSGLEMHTIHVGGGRYFGNSEKVRPYALGTVGGTGYYLDSSEFRDVWKFSFGVAGGAKVYLSDRIGVRAQGRLQGNTFVNGLGIYCGTGGCGVGVNSAAVMLALDFSAGVFLKLGE